MSSALIIGLIFDMFLESIIFMAAYIPLRSFAGGYHAKTPVRCYFASLILIFAVLLFCKYVPFNLLLYGGMLLVSSVAIAFLCPVQDNNKPLDGVEQRRYKKFSITILLVEIYVWTMLVFVIHVFEPIIPIAVLLEILMLIFGVLKNKFLS